jgi:tetratricopeptide (TPR) repeat protein
MAMKKIDKYIVVSIIITAIIYINLFKNNITNWDDDIYILKNPYITSLSIDSLKKIFSIEFAGNYHPLTLLSLAINYKISGIKPWSYQLFNLLFHLINIILVYFFIKNIINFKNNSDKTNQITPFIVAFFFGIHTLQVESVAWISERKNVLYTLFYFSSLIFYLKYIKNKFNRDYIFSMILFILSLFSKGMAVPLSLCLILIDYYTGRKILSKKVIIEKIPFLILSVIFGIIAIKVQQSSGATGREDYITIIERIAIASYGFTMYIIKLLFPFKLSAYYPYPMNIGENLPLQYYLFIIIPVLLIILLFKYFLKNKNVLFGVIFFILNIILVLQLIPVGDAIMADRYVYIPIVGFFFVVGYYGNIIWERYAKFRYIFLSIFLLYAYTICFKSYHRVQIWRDSLTLWNNSIDNYPKYNDRGYLNRGNLYLDMNKYLEAFKDYNRVLLFHPMSVSANIGMGLLKMDLKDYDGAIEHFNQALNRKKIYELYVNIAVIKILLNDYENAKKYLDTANILNPLGPEVFINRGIIDINLKNYYNAIEEFNKATKLNKYHNEPYLYRGVAYIDLEKYQEAIEELNNSIQLKPIALAYYYRAVAYIKTNNKDKGCEDFQIALSKGNIEDKIDNEIFKACE